MSEFYCIKSGNWFLNDYSEIEGYYWYDTPGIYRSMSDVAHVIRLATESWNSQLNFEREGEALTDTQVKMKNNLTLLANCQVMKISFEAV